MERIWQTEIRRWWAHNCSVNDSYSGSGKRIRIIICGDGSWCAVYESERGRGTYAVAIRRNGTAWSVDENNLDTLTEMHDGDRIFALLQLAMRNGHDGIR